MRFGLVLVFEADEPSVVGEVSDDFVLGEEAEGLLLAGGFEPVADFGEAVLPMETGLAAGLFEGLFAVLGVELVDQAHEDPNARVAASFDEPFGPFAGLGADFGGAALPVAGGLGELVLAAGAAQRLAEPAGFEFGVGWRFAPGAG